ncbi:MAG: TrkA family potassium uptake protein [Fimbriimonadales bacterium]|nr:TrkA family potassium uptake protein [Fimbriimonadales bacterium]
MYVIVVGGGQVGVHLTKRLLQAGREVLLLEKDGGIISSLKVQIGESVMVGDGCEAQTQKRAGFQRADVVVAVTGDDEDNLVICQMAKNTWGVSRTIARVNDPTHMWLFRELGVSSSVSATDVLYNLIEQEISVGTVIPLAALRMGNIEVVEATLTARSPSVGKLVREIEIPPKSNIVWLLRGDEGIVVDGDTRLQEGDLVVALVPTASESALRNVL